MVSTDFDSQPPSLHTFQCFLCKTKSEFTELCNRFQSDIVDADIQPLFEVTKTGHAPWLSQASNEQNLASGYTQGETLIVMQHQLYLLSFWFRFRFRSACNDWGIG